MFPPCAVMDLETVLNVLRSPEPIENDLARQVEYDMDEQGSFVFRLLADSLMLDFRPGVARLCQWGKKKGADRHGFVRDV